jgi:hypothetical protein
MKTTNDKMFDCVPCQIPTIITAAIWKKRIYNPHKRHPFTLSQKLNVSLYLPRMLTLIRSVCSRFHQIAFTPTKQALVAQDIFANATTPPS